MISDTTQAMTISKNNTGFPGYLDFTRLRTEGINHLGKLSGKIWNDHNVHDPGITILEELCYAMLDLGYRTNLPVADILATDPSAVTAENNFFTPAQILTNNPLTIIDYRKLLIDLPGIRNAWLQPARDIRDLCRGARQGNDKSGVKGAAAEGKVNEGTVEPRAGMCEEFLNGIYHVFIETEVDLDKDFANADPNVEEVDKQQFIKEITDLVRRTLMARRNLCEDFADIYILCKLETGVCATIEIEDGADVEAVYVDVINQLRDYFSPTPKFYTLDQILARGRSMDEAFAGRPFSKRSHGFIDTDELEGIELRKEIHTSDIYHSIFDAKGVRKVTRLKFRNCGKKCYSADGKPDTEWVIHLPHNHIPVFSLSCSGLEFTMNGLPIHFDQEKLNTELELAGLYNGKVRYKMPSPYLDAEIPTGTYHPDLGEHYSIQNDFPAVYGIGEGDLPDDVSDQRKAQMLQLRGYLMFFDQMLANYLSQLQNIRQLFSFNHPGDPSAEHTYFLNNIRTIPEMDKLLRFGAGNGLGPAGTVLGYPIDKSAWDTTVFSSQPAASLIAGFTAFTFTSLYGVYEATDLLRNDLVNEGESTIAVQQAQDLNWIYAVVSSSSEYVMLGNKFFATKEEAERHASSIQYAGVFEENYQTVVVSGTQFTFNLDLTLITYTDYLGILVEDENLYEKRRTGFLTHLLSRFAEQFSDFVIYNWKSAMGISDIEAAEGYLTEYPDLSRNRGRAFNYLLDGLIDNNVSGFEKKVKAIAGIPTYQKNHLCNFVVEPFDETYFFDPLLKGKNAVPNAGVEAAFASGAGAGAGAGIAADERAGAAAGAVAVNNERTGFVYRLVDKNHLPASFSMAFNDPATALSKRLPLTELTRKVIDRMPQVNVEQDHYREFSPGRFNFIISVTNIEGVAGELILFSSTAAYSSKQEASQAFSEQVCDVLAYARDKTAFGDYIISGAEPATANTIARIPDDALIALQDQFGINWIDELVERLGLYPFRKIDISSVEYAELHCQDYVEPAPGEPRDPDKIKYYFNFPLTDDLPGDWISTTHFDSLEDTMAEFAFFNKLVNYPGNYFADCACTGFYDKDHMVHRFGYKIFMREVLAQSTDVFATASEAWGPRGIERFICAAQGTKPFWPYQRSKECFSFYVTCGSGALQHPCTYPSESIRRKAIAQLVETGTEFIKRQSWFFNAVNGELFDEQGKPFAAIGIDKVPGQDRCDLYITVAEFLNGQLGFISYHSQTGFLRYSLPTGIFIQSIEKRPGLSQEDENDWISQWGRQLSMWACYFPVVRTQLKTAKGEPAQFTYCVEVKLPGFGDCGGPENDNGRLAIDNVRGREGTLCQVAWKSTCCFSSCLLAMAALQDAWKILADKNYHLVFDCTDNSYGIALHTYNPSIIGGNQGGAQSDIIAINPQCYSTTKDDCSAIDRAIRLINIQGLHLIEHILLRPMKQEDCRCRIRMANCGTDCEFPSWVEHDPECENRELQTCFKPGTDPYSFIATVFLPAWSKRFRDPDQRLLFEQLLYREAPAHVLLRIIWLRPLDFCRLESTMYDWHKWLAGFTGCNLDFNPCTLIDLLFNRYYECLPECTDCLPCKDPEPVKPGCWDVKDRILRPLGFVDQINAMYCFEDYCRRVGEKPREEPKEKPREEPKDERKDEPKDEPKKEPKDQPNDDPKPKQPDRNPKPLRKKKPESPIDHVTNIARRKTPKKKDK